MKSRMPAVRPKYPGEPRIARKFVPIGGVLNWRGAQYNRQFTSKLARSRAGFPSDRFDLSDW
jgi:hypothetical protein